MRSYLAGNNSKNLFNTINKVLYNKYKINLITQKNILIYYRKLIKYKIYGNNS